MNKPKDKREELRDEAAYATYRLAEHYQEYIDYWQSRCQKAEDDLSDMEEKYQELVKGIRPAKPVSGAIRHGSDYANV